MSRVAVITAPNTGYLNPGMVTVDLAFEALRRRMDGKTNGVHATWYTLHQPDMAPLRSYVGSTELPFRFRSLSEHLTELHDHDAVVFWGDFLHAAHYLTQDATTRMLDFGVRKDRTAARSLLHRTLLLSEEPDDLLARTLVYGGTIIHNAQSDYDDKEYGQSFYRLMARSHRIWMRDPLSATKVAHFRRDHTTGHFGSDAAFLLRPEDLDFLPVTEWSQGASSGGQIGVFLGARTHIPDWLPGFCDEISSRFGAPLEWVPWFDHRPVPQQVAHIAKRPGDFTLGDLLASLSQYRMVITDTYHLCINAWRAGTPALCVGAPQPTPTTENDYLTLSDIKKQVLYTAYDAADFYLSTLSADEGRERLIERITRLLEGGGAEAVAMRMRDHAEWSAANFTETLASML